MGQPLSRLLAPLPGGSYLGDCFPVDSAANHLGLLLPTTASQFIDMGLFT